MTFPEHVAAELTRARSKHADIHNLHEGYAVLLEELDELWERVRMPNTDHGGDWSTLRELVQIGAMAQRIAEDVILRNDQKKAEELVGRVVEVGDIECLQDESGQPKAGILIETTQEALRAFPLNLAFAEVVIRLKANARPHAEAIADSGQAEVRPGGDK
jgi:hypothetical protein